MQLSGRRRGSAAAALDGEPLPNSPRSLGRQVKLHRLLKQLHSQDVKSNGSGEGAEGEEGSDPDALAAALAQDESGAGSSTQPGHEVDEAALIAVGEEMIERSRASGRSSKRVVKPPGGRSSDGADGAVKGEAHSAAAAGAASAANGSDSSSHNLHIEVPDGEENGSRGRGRGRGGGRKGPKGSGQPNFERNKHRKKGCVASPTCAY